MIIDPQETETASELDADMVEENQARLELIYELSKQVGTAPRMAQLLESVIEMTQQTLKASAASVLLFSDNDRSLLFEATSGPVGNMLRKVKIDSRSGIAGKVVRTGKPMIINNVEQSQYFNRTIDEITGFVTRSLLCVPLILNRRTLGVIEVLNKVDGSNFNEQDLATVSSVAATAAMAIENTRLHQNLLGVYRSTIKTLAAAIDAKDPYTRGHSERVMKYALLGGTHLSLSDNEMEALEYAGILHDIGKIAIDTCILHKPESLSASEWEIVREHPVTGARLLEQIPSLEQASQFVLHHHERFSGYGYPSGLVGEKIPMGARLLAVADAFDSMTTDRAYRPALSIDQSIKELCNCTGTQFCPVAVEAFVSSFCGKFGKNDYAIPPRIPDRKWYLPQKNVPL